MNEHWSEYYGDALVVATEAGNVPLARFVLEHGQNPNLKRGMSDIQAGPWAIRAGHDQSVVIELLQLMLQHGWKHKGTASFICAAEMGNVEAMKLLLENDGDLEEAGIWWQVTDLESVNSTGTALYRACMAGQVDSVKWLLEQGADPTAKDKIGRSCLDTAKSNGHEEIVKILEDKVV